LQLGFLKTTCGGGWLNLKIVPAVLKEAAVALAILNELRLD